MFRQVLVQKDLRKYQLILWRKQPSDSLGIYQLNTITYGTASAPYLSMRCLRQLAKECDDNTIASTILNDFFVDDLITGHDDSKTLLEICENVSRVLQSGCFPLRKWTLNFDVTQALSKNLSIGDLTQNKTLGLGWLNSTDELYYTTKIEKDKIQLTKRGMLAIISHIYDPLGLLCPAIITAKVLLQKLWLLKIGWDEPIQDKIIINTWNQFIDSLQYLHKLHLPRFVRSIYTQRTELHIFSDASQDAYGACAYVRTSNGTNVIVNLLCAKSKVAPLKTISIPRLELCGAFLGAKLYHKITESLTLKFDDVIFWTDSTIVMGWLRMSPHLLKTFVQNRVSEINELTKESQWLHIDGKSNPADLLSRGLDLRMLSESELWWHGPECLHDDEWSHSRFQRYEGNCDDLPEVKVNKGSYLTTHVISLIDFDRFSSFSRLLHTVAYVLRFTNNTRNKHNRRMDSICVDELREAERVLVQLSQLQSFNELQEHLVNNTSLKSLRDKKLFNQVSSLNLFVDEAGLIRVGGRLSNSNFEYEKKHPLLLSSKHRLTTLLIEWEHEKLLHAAPQLLLYNLRERWWIIGARNLTRKIVHSCVRCARVKPRTLTPIMGDLPSSRMDPGFPFSRCGVDYAGPILMLNRKGRGAELIKGYICLFICFATRAVHLELVGSLSSNDYILAFKRFISRRGKPMEVFSDNGKNFVGAEKELARCLDENHPHASDFLVTQSIKFHRIPLYASHFGGLWEAGVKSCKFHLKRVIRSANLNYEEFSTLLSQIEAILNSRPMTPLSADPNDLLPLTPSHFIIGRTLTSPYSNDLVSEKTQALTRFQRIEQLRQHFWQRWSKEYISELQQRCKWKTHKEDIKLDSLVLIKEDQLPPLLWRLGRVSQVYTGRDGVSRVADLRTSTGVVSRAWSKICPLPLQ